MNGLQQALFEIDSHLAQVRIDIELATQNNTKLLALFDQQADAWKTIVTLYLSTGKTS